MALTVNSDPLDPGCNSYVSLAEMLTYLEDRVPNDAYRIAWERLSDAQKSQYLVNATRTLDTLVDWIGDRYWRDQRLDWPRVNAFFDGYLLDNTVIPDRIKEATCEMAKWSMENAGAVSIEDNPAYDKIKVGPIEIDFNEQVGGSAKKYFPDIVGAILDGLGTLHNPELPNSTSLKQVRLRRA